MKKLNIVFIGCVQFSGKTLQKVIELQNSLPIQVTGIITRKDSKYNSDFLSLEDFAVKNGIPYLLAEGNDQSKMAAWIRERRPDVVYCFGWSYLLNIELLSIPPLGIIGYHPALLPKNRGRHPIIWALALGLNETGSTFFFMNEGADSGDILHQEKVAIEPDDDASTLYQKLTETALEQIPIFTEQLIHHTCKPIPQVGPSNVWRKRGKADGLIDWRMTAESIHNLIRALTRPYVGAHFSLRGAEVKVWRSKLMHVEGVQNIEPGKVLAVADNQLVVKCGKGCLMIQEHDCLTIPKEGSYLY